MKKLVRFLHDESGATAIEYGLIVTGVSLGIIAAVNGLGATLGTKFASSLSYLVEWSSQSESGDEQDRAEQREPRRHQCQEAVEDKVTIGHETPSLGPQKRVPVPPWVDENTVRLCRKTGRPVGSLEAPLAHDGLIVIRRSDKLRPSGGAAPWHKRIDFAARPAVGNALKCWGEPGKRISLG